MARINLKRAWLLLSIFWLSAVSFHFWPKVQDGWHEAQQVREELNRGLRERKFLDCATGHGVNWFQHQARYEYQCKAEAEKNCAGDLLCGTDWQTDGCIKSKVRGCEHLAWLVAGDGSESDLSDSDFRSKEKRERLFFFMDRSFSTPLYQGIAWAITPLLLALTLPGLGRRLWRWLTTVPPT